MVRLFCALPSPTPDIGYASTFACAQSHACPHIPHKAKKGQEAMSQTLLVTRPSHLFSLAIFFIELAPDFDKGLYKRLLLLFGNLMFFEATGKHFVDTEIFQALTGLA